MKTHNHNHHHHHHHQHHHHQPTTKLKNPPRPLFTCGIFSYCTTSESVLSPTNNTPTPPSTFPPPVSDPIPHSSPPPPLPLSDPQPPPPPPQPQPESSSTSSSSSTSQSFTQWRFPVPNSPIQSQPTMGPFPPNPPPETSPESDPQPPPPPTFTNLAELFHVAELQFSTGSEASKLSALHLLERSLVPNPPTEGDQDPTTCCPPAVMAEVVGLLKSPLGAKPATKVLLALCLSEPNRHVAVEAGAVVEVIEALAEVEGSAAERALAALELLCTVGEGAAQLKQHALAVPMLIQVMGKMEGRGKECAVSVLALMFGGGFLMEEEEEEEDGHGGGGGGGAPEAVGRAVVLALQGECSARGRRKGVQLLKVLQENGRLDLTQDGR